MKTAVRPMTIEVKIRVPTGIAADFQIAAIKLLQQMLGEISSPQVTEFPRLSPARDITSLDAQSLVNRRVRVRRGKFAGLTGIVHARANCSTRKSAAPYYVVRVDLPDGGTTKATLVNTSLEVL